MRHTRAWIASTRRFWRVSLLLVLASAGHLGGWLVAVPAGEAGEIGSTGALFLAVESGTRALGMAGATTALPGGAGSVRWNPATLHTSRSELVFEHAPLFDDLSYEWIGFASGPSSGGQEGRFALALGLLRVGTIDGRDASGLPTVELTSYAAELALTWARPVVGEHLHFGATFKAAREVFGEASGFGMAADLGLHGQYGPWHGGLAATQLGRYRFDGEILPLPSEFRVGNAIEVLAGDLTVAADAHLPQHAYASVRVGAEWTLHPHLALRSGYRLEPTAPSDLAVEGPSFGASARLGSTAALRYAFVSAGGIDPTHHVGFTLRFADGE